MVHLRRARQVSLEQARLIYRFNFKPEVIQVFSTYLRCCLLYVACIDITGYKRFILHAHFGLILHYISPMRPNRVQSEAIETQLYNYTRIMIQKKWLGSQKLLNLFCEGLCARLRPHRISRYHYHR